MALLFPWEKQIGIEIQSRLDNFNQPSLLI